METRKIKRVKAESALIFSEMSSTDLMRLRSGLDRELESRRLDLPQEQLRYLDSVRDELRRRGIHLSAITGKAAIPARRAAASMDEFFGRLGLDSTGVRLALCRVLAGAAVDAIEEASGGRAVLAAVLNRLGQSEALFRDQFPDYIENGLIPFLVRQMEERR